MFESRSCGKNADMRPFAVVCVAAALWLASLAYALIARAVCAENVRKTASNVRFVSELAAELAAVRTHCDFIAALPSADGDPTHPFADNATVKTAKSTHNGLVKTSVAAKWNAIAGDSFAGVVEDAGNAEPPLRLESATVTKAGATGADTIAVDATFVNYTR